MCSAQLIKTAPTASTQPSSFPGKLGDVQRRGTLIIATDYDYAPQSELVAGVLRLAETRCIAKGVLELFFIEPAAG